MRRGDIASHIQHGATEIEIAGEANAVPDLAAVLALLLALFEEGIAATCMDRGLAEFRGALDQPFVYISLESVVPGVLLHADLPDLAAALAPRPLMLSRLVDAQNRALELPAASRNFVRTTKSYEQAKAGKRLAVSVEASAATWLVDQLKEDR